MQFTFAIPVPNVAPNNRINSDPCQRRSAPLSRARYAERSTREKMDERKTRINPPLYLASTTISCWWCGANLKFSKATQSEYYANTCSKCGVISGDFYLHSEPGAPFFPTTEDEARRLTLEAVPMHGSIEVQAGLAMGCGDLIMEYGNRRNAEQGSAGALPARA